MNSMLPIIRISELQKHPRESLDQVTDYAVIRSHSEDVALVLHPQLGKALLQSPAFRDLLAQCSQSFAEQKSNTPVDMKTLDKLIGSVLRELSKR